jgi:hypothetical protein
MAIDPATMMMIAKGVGNMAQSGSRLLQPRFQNTKYGQMLRERSRNGNLSQAQESNILNKVGTQAGNNAQVARNKYIGSAINQGMGNSVALQRGLRESEADVRRTVTDTSRDIYQNEETAKSNAKMNYARAMDQDSSERRGALTSMITGGANTALQAGATEYGARDAQRLKDLPKGMDKLMQEYQKFNPQTGKKLIDTDPGGFFGKLLESGISRDSAKDLMRFLQTQEKQATRPEDINIMLPQYRVNPNLG